MKIIDSHKACYEYTTFFEGLAGHSSKPDEGVNAAEYASKYVNKLMSLRNDLIIGNQKTPYLLLPIQLYRLVEYLEELLTML